MTTYYSHRILVNLEATFDGDRQRLAAATLASAEAERTAQGIAAIEPSVLAALFATSPWRAWAALAQLTERQRVVEAIDYACYLETQGVVLSWGDIRACWERKLAQRAAEAEALLALAEQGAFDADGGHEDEGREEPVATVEVASSKGDGTTYTVAVDGSHCTCKGFFYRGTCRHVKEILDSDDDFDPRVDADQRYAA
jgi:hypothetical protein